MCPRCCPQVHLALDTSGQGGRMGVRAFVSRALGLGGNELAREFLEASLVVGKLGNSLACSGQLRLKARPVVHAVAAPGVQPCATAGT